MYKHYLDNLSIENVIASIRDYQQEECVKIHKYYDYYNSRHEILNREGTEGRACNKVVSNEVRKICDIYNGFVGACDIDSTDPYFNDILSEISDSIKDCIITGVGYGTIYYDKKLTFKRIAPTYAMVFRDTTISHNVIGGVYWNTFSVMENGFAQEYYELYVVDNTTISYYKGKSLEGVTYVKEWKHNIPGVPLIEFRPDSHYDSCFSPAISLQDMLNLSLSSYADGRETFSDSYLVITGMGMSEDTANSLIDGDKKLLNLPLEHATATYLTKTDSATDLTTMLDDVTERLYRSCSIPLTDDVRMGTASGAALVAKYMSLTRICSTIRKSLDGSLEELSSKTTNFKYTWPDYFADVTEVENPTTEVVTEQSEV